MSDVVPAQARVVVIGGGIAGCSVAYHLAKLGWRDVVLLERRELSCGTTWHAAGLVGQLRATHNLTRLAKYGADLYERLEAETGQATGFRRPGSLSLARNAERMHELKRAWRRWRGASTSTSRSSRRPRRDAAGRCCAPTTWRARCGCRATGAPIPSTPRWLSPRARARAASRSSRTPR